MTMCFILYLLPQRLNRLERGDRLVALLRQYNPILEAGGRWSGRWVGGEETEFYVQVVDQAGNVGVEDNGGAYYRPQQEYGVYLLILMHGQWIRRQRAR